MTGVSRSCVCLFLEHPLESIKTQWQTKIDIKHKHEIVRHIFQEKGLIGFYRGFIPNLIRVSIKQLYRWPMMLYFPKFYKKYSPYNTDGFAKVLTGLTIANIEIFIICPLDRLKIYFMTQDKVNKSVFTYFLYRHGENLSKELFAGLGPSFWRSNISWVSFLYLDHISKRTVKNYKQEEVLTFLDLLVISVFVGIGNLASSKSLYNLSHAFRLREDTLTKGKQFTRINFFNFTPVL
jgi:hypothetical protein